MDNAARRIFLEASADFHRCPNTGKIIEAMRFEGVLRAHRMAADFTARDSARYSIVQAEWPEVKRRLISLLERA